MKKIKKSKYKKISQKTNINIKIGNNTKPTRRQYNRRKPTRVLPPSPYIINPYGLALNNNPGFIRQDNDVFNKKLLNMLEDQNTEFKKLGSTIVTKIEDVTPKEQTTLMELPPNTLSLDDFSTFLGNYEKGRLKDIIKKQISKDKFHEKNLYKDIVEPTITGEYEPVYPTPPVTETKTAEPETSPPIDKPEKKKKMTPQEAAAYARSVRQQIIKERKNKEKEQIQEQELEKEFESNL